MIHASKPRVPRGTYYAQQSNTYKYLGKLSLVLGGIYAGTQEGNKWVLGWARTRAALHCAGVESAGQKGVPVVGRGANRDRSSTWRRMETEFRQCSVPRSENLKS